MTREQKKHIKKLMKKTECPFGFRCYKTRFVDLCARVKNDGFIGFLEVIERPLRAQCIHFVAYGYSGFCKCPLALYVMKNKVKM